MCMRLGPETFGGRVLKAAQWNGSGSLDVVDYEVADPEPGWVRLAVAACGICGSDLHGFRHSGGGTAGHQPGHEVAGFCESTTDFSSTDTGIEEGRLYALEPIISCGQCKPCLAGFHNRCRKRSLVGAGAPGGLAQQVLVPAQRLHPLPLDFDVNLAALAEPLAVGVRAMRLGDVRGKSVAIIGAGSIGLLCIPAAVEAGARDVFITARHDHQAELARHLGATMVFDSSEALTREMGDDGVDVVVETVGGKADTLIDAAAMAAPGGVIVKLGVFVGNTPIPSMPFLDKELTLIGSLCYASDVQRGDFAITTDLLAQRAAHFEPVITHRFSLGEINKAFETALDKSTQSIKVQVMP